MLLKNAKHSLAAEKYQKLSSLGKLTASFSQGVLRVRRGTKERKGCRGVEATCNVRLLKGKFYY